MPIPVLFFLGYSLVLGTYEVAKTSKRSNKKTLNSVIKYGKRNSK